jgi:LL-diaminopimelate aminotransferase
MATINEHFLKLPDDYLFYQLRRRVSQFKADHPDADIISLGLGDVTQPLAPVIVAAMKDAADEMSAQETFRGYGPSKGYDFLVDAIIEKAYKPRGVSLSSDEVFVSDGSKCDLGNITEIFGQENTVAVPDPVFPLYVDTNVMAGRTGAMKSNGQYDQIVYMPCTPENEFVPNIPDGKVDLIYLCFPNNPTGAVARKEQLDNWIEYARSNDAIILYDGAYEAYIVDENIPHSIYEIEGAMEVAIEFRSFSKMAGFTGVRCGYIVIPKQLMAGTSSGSPIMVNPIWSRRHNTKFNGVSYITQAGAASVFSKDGQKQTSKTIELYLNNATVLRTGLADLGYTTYGGVNAPYVWVRIPGGMSSWDFFDYILEKAHVIVTPGVGFGPSGEGYVRLSALATPDNVVRATERLVSLD